MESEAQLGALHTTDDAPPAPKAEVVEAAGEELDLADLAAPEEELEPAPRSRPARKNKKPLASPPGPASPRSARRSAFTAPSAAAAATVSGAGVPPGSSAQAPGAGDGLCGRRIYVYWEGDAVFYGGRVLRYRVSNGLHEVVYDTDGQKEWLDLRQQRCAWPPAGLHPGAHAAAQGALAALRAVIDPERGAIYRPFELLPTALELPEYYERVAQPVDFKQLEERLARAGYDDAAAFAADVRRMFSNAMLFNGDDSALGRDAVTLRATFDEYCALPHVAAAFDTLPPRPLASVPSGGLPEGGFDGEDPASCIGRRVRVPWTDRRLYGAVIAAWDAGKGLHKVVYDDGGLHEWLSLGKRRVTWAPPEEPHSKRLSFGDREPPSPLGWDREEREQAAAALSATRNALAPGGKAAAAAEAAAPVLSALEARLRRGSGARGGFETGAAFVAAGDTALADAANQATADGDGDSVRALTALRRTFRQACAEAGLPPPPPQQRRRPPARRLPAPSRTPQPKRARAPPPPAGEPPETPAEAVGRSLRVWWSGDSEWYRGRVLSYDESRGAKAHLIRYVSDGFEEWTDLGSERVRWAQEESEEADNEEEANSDDELGAAAALLAAFGHA